MFYDFYLHAVLFLENSKTGFYRYMYTTELFSSHTE